MNNVGKRWYNEELWTNASIVTKMLIGTATLNFTSKSLGIHQIRNTYLRALLQVSSAFDLFRTQNKTALMKEVYITGLNLCIERPVSIPRGTVGSLVTGIISAAFLWMGKISCRKCGRPCI